ncbi:MAG TPA: hypothetical protein VK586_25605 [Streptosporangiaceae bacterium]|nr:hypothetical protein [Streptosporangiaceae bacterium]
MRTAASIAVIAAGAILALAVSARVPGVNLRLAGVIIIAAGIAVLLAPPSPAADWLRRRWGRSADPAGPSPAPRALADPGEEAYPAYLLQDPAVLAAEVLNGIRSDSWAQPAAAAPPASTSPPASTGPTASVSPTARTPRAAARPAGRAAGPRPLRSVDLGREAIRGRDGNVGRRNEFG